MLCVLLLLPQCSRLAAWGDHGFTDRRVTCEHLPLPESGDTSGVTNDSPAATSVPRRACAVGVLAYTTGREETRASVVTRTFWPELTSKRILSLMRSGKHSSLASRESGDKSSSLCHVISVLLAESIDEPLFFLWRANSQQSEDKEAGESDQPVRRQQRYRTHE